MKPNAEQEKALREKIKRQSLDNQKSELRPIEKYSLKEDITKISKSSENSDYKLSQKMKLLILVVLIAIGILGFYLI